MIPTMFELELRDIDRLPRQELIKAIREKRNCLRADLLEGLEEQSTQWLQLLLLAARLLHVLRRMDRHT
jgi:hypothetical protein